MKNPEDDILMLPPSNRIAEGGATEEKWEDFVKGNIKMKVANEEGEVDSVPTTCYGRINFEETTTKDLPHFIRCSDETEPEVIYQLMTKHWNLKKPGALISFTGGAKDFELDPQIKDDFVKGFANVASKLSAWTISGGMTSGCMKYVGESFYGTTNVCIGIASWGVVTHRDRLMDADKFYHSYPLPSGRGRGAFLNPNHTHFVLIDNGQENRWGVEIPFRGNFEGRVASYDDNILPSILLSMEGGPGTIGTIISLLSSNTPCVLFKGSGRATDVVIYALANSREILALEDGDIHQGLMDRIVNELTWPGCREEQKMKIYDHIISCLGKDDLFFICDPKNGMNTEDSILTASLYASKSSSRYEKLKMSMLWDVPQFANDQIMRGWLSWGELSEEESGQLLIMALALNRVEFVRYFIKAGASIKRVVTSKVLNFLYGFRLGMEFSTLHYEGVATTVMDDPGERLEFFQSLLQYKYKDGVKRDVPGRPIVHSTLLSDVPKLHHYLLPKTRLLPNEQNVPEKVVDDPYQHLFVWALVNNLHEMSSMIWEYLEENLAHALLAAELSSELLNRAEHIRMQGQDTKISVHNASRMTNDSDGITLGITEDMLGTLQKTQSVFQQHALDLLDECRRSDQHNVIPLIAKEIETIDGYKGQSCLTQAIQSKDVDFSREFISHQSVQDVLDEVWMGSLARKNIQGYEILMYIFLPVFLAVRFEKMLLKNDTTKWGYEKKMDDRKDFLKKIPYFYLYSPAVRFYLHTIGYVLFVMLFSYVAMLKKTTTTPGLSIHIFKARSAFSKQLCPPLSVLLCVSVTLFICMGKPYLCF